MRKRCRISSQSEGTILVEVLVAGLILLLVFTAVVHEVTNLSVLRVQLETRDRAVAYASSLHEQLKAAGCGFDVDFVEPVMVPDPDNPGNNKILDGGFRGPWGRVQGCALSAKQEAFKDAQSRNDTSGQYYWVDGNNNVRISNATGAPNDPITLETAREFCDTYGQDNLCNLGDQSYEYIVPTIGNTAEIKFDVQVNYWFEKVGTTTKNTQCSVLNQIGVGTNAGYSPDVIARRVSITWEEKGGQPQSLVITKRDNVPVDSVEFARGTRVGLTYDGDSARLSLNAGDPGGNYPYYVQRDKTDGNCVWFPFIKTDRAAGQEVRYSTRNTADGEFVGFTTAALPSVATQNGAM